MEKPGSIKDPNYLLWVSSSYYNLADLITDQPEPHFKITSAYYDAPLGQVVLGHDPDRRPMKGAVLLDSLIEMETYKGYRVEDSVSNSQAVAGALGYAFLDFWERQRRDRLPMDIIVIHNSLMTVNERLVSTTRNLSDRDLSLRRIELLLRAMSHTVVSVELT